MPARVPLLLVNGASGIAVGIATNIPPHNLREVVDGLCALIHNPDITIKQLMQHIPAPDFPTGPSPFPHHTGLSTHLFPPPPPTLSKSLYMQLCSYYCVICRMCQVYTKVSTLYRICASGGEILETALIGQAYHEGRGSITVRGKVHIEDEQPPSTTAGSKNGSTGTGSRSKSKTSRKGSSGRPHIIITELPYQSNKVNTTSLCGLTGCNYTSAQVS